MAFDAGDESVGGSLCTCGDDEQAAQVWVCVQAQLLVSSSRPSSMWRGQQLVMSYY
jgi:hypothetical protein